MYVTCWVVVLQVVVFRELVNVRYARYTVHKELASSVSNTPAPKPIKKPAKRFGIAVPSMEKPLMNPEIPLFRSLQ